MANTPTGSELDAMAELVKQMWERFIRPRVMDELMKHSLEGYKASVVSNNGDGTLTVVRPFDTQTMTLRCPPALANWAEEGDQVLVVSLGDASNSFILCKTDMEGFGSSTTGERIKNLDFSHLISNYFTVRTEHDVLELYTVSRDEHGRIDQIEDSEGFETGVDWPEYEPLPARDVGYDNTESGASSTNVQDALDELFEGGGGGGTEASAVSYDNTGTGLTATNVQDAIDEVYEDIPSQASDIGAQDEITASGILKGDGAGGVSAAVAGTDYQAPLTFDNTPTENSTNPVKSGGVYSDVRTRVPNFGKGKNLLDNWYFLNPVNQRGQSSYTGAVRGIDRWVCRHSTGTVNVTTNGITLSKGSGTAIDFYQPQEEVFNKQLAGKTVTVSVLLYPNRFVTGTGKWQVSSSGAVISETDFNVALGGTTTAWTNFYIRASSDITIQAIKLELGSESTLCHNEGTEANPVWVLNETADYEKELIKCQTNTANSGDTYANKSLATEQQIAYVETGPTASRAYVVGECFCWNGLLYRVKTAISSGDLLTPGTNCVSKTVGNGLGSVYSILLGTNSSHSIQMQAGVYLVTVKPFGYTTSFGVYLVTYSVGTGEHSVLTIASAGTIPTLSLSSSGVLSFTTTVSTELSYINFINFRV